VLKLHRTFFTGKILYVYQSEKNILFLPLMKVYDLTLSTPVYVTTRHRILPNTLQF